MTPEPELTDRQKYLAAMEEQRLQRYTEPVPARITMALDLRELYGPDVDIACGAVEPDVDRWEDPDDPLLPTAEQVRLLAKLTNFPVGFFYRPLKPWEGVMYVCRRSGPKADRCQRIDSPIPAKKPPAAPAQGRLW